MTVGLPQYLDASCQKTVGLPQYLHASYVGDPALVLDIVEKWKTSSNCPKCEKSLSSHQCEKFPFDVVFLFLSKHKLGLPN